MVFEPEPEKILIELSVVRVARDALREIDRTRTLSDAETDALLHLSARLRQVGW